MSVWFSFLHTTSVAVGPGMSCGRVRAAVQRVAGGRAAVPRAWPAAVVMALWPFPATAAEQPGEALPKWEAGIAGGGAWTPHYPAADESGNAIIAAPYLKYRGRRLRLGEDGLVTGRFFRTDRIHVTASVRGSLPADSADNRARAGMPDLDALFEVGPQVELLLAGRREENSVSLKLPLRFVFSTDFSDLKDRGVVFQPRFSYRRESLLGADGLSGTVSLGPSFASERLMDYFYEVAPQFATPQRPAYQAEGGYLGSDIALSLNYRLSQSFSVLVGVEFSYYGGATNDDSPLFRSDSGVKAGAGFVWRAWRSAATAAE